jgi:hypothetical protein
MSRGSTTTTSNTEVSYSPPLQSFVLETADSSVDLSRILPLEVQTTILFYVKTQKLSRFNNEPRGFINHTSWAPQRPPLLSIPRLQWDKNQLVPYIAIPPAVKDDNGYATAWVDIVINNLDDGSHPFHLHGHSFYVVSRYRAERLGGWGSWNPYSGKPAPGGLNLETPLLKDTVSVPRRGHVVLRLQVERHGLWMLHCHMLVHLGSGMAVGMHIGLDGDSAHVLESDENAAGLCVE